MTTEHQVALFGIDLDLGLVPAAGLAAAAGPPTRGDLRVAARGTARSAVADVGTARGARNLVQAILLRLLTARGELAGIGEPTYGSRHHALVGEPDTAANRALLKLHVLECLRQEPRVARVLRADVRQEPGREGRGAVRVELSLRVIELPEPLNLVVDFSFSGGVR